MSDTTQPQLTFAVRDADGNLREVDRPSDEWFQRLAEAVLRLELLAEARRREDGG